MDRSSPTDAKAILDTILQDMPDRDGALNFFVNSIQHAHGVNPAGWGVTLLPDRIRLNVGQLTVATLEREGLWITLKRDSISAEDRETLDRSSDWTWLDDGGYKMVKTDPGYCTGSSSDSELYGALEPPLYALINYAGNRWAQLRANSRQAHSPGVLRMLAGLTGRRLPEPAFEPVKIDDALEGELSELPDFNPANVTEGRQLEIAGIVRQRGQPEFRKRLLQIYGGRCVITGCDVQQTLEAAHILPYNGVETNHPANGLLLRSDLHTLFDLGLITVDTKKMTVAVDEQLTGTVYEQYQGVNLSDPSDKDGRPNKKALDRHRHSRGLLRPKE